MDYYVNFTKRKVGHPSGPGIDWDYSLPSGCGGGYLTNNIEEIVPRLVLGVLSKIETDTNVLLKSELSLIDYEFQRSMEISQNELLEIRNKLKKERPDLEFKIVNPEMILMMNFN